MNTSKKGSLTGRKRRTKRTLLNQHGIYPNDFSNNSKIRKQNKKYGFDQRDIYNMDYTMVVLLLERLELYLDKAGKIVDLDYHKIEYEGTVYTQRELAEKLRLLCVETAKELETYIREYPTEKVKEIWSIWKELSFHMWY